MQLSRKPVLRIRWNTLIEEDRDKLWCLNIVDYNVVGKNACAHIYHTTILRSKVVDKKRRAHVNHMITLSDAVFCPHTPAGRVVFHIEVNDTLNAPTNSKGVG